MSSRNSRNLVWVLCYLKQVSKYRREWIVLVSDDGTTPVFLFFLDAVKGIKILEEKLSFGLVPKKVRRDNLFSPTTLVPEMTFDAAEKEMGNLSS